MAQNYLDRLFDEAEELNKKISSLTSFMLTDEFFVNISRENRDDLRDQLDCMKEYAKVLARRIDRETE